LIEAARTIVEEIQPCSIGAVCYRLFTIGLIESMVKTETNRVSVQLTRAREAGLLPWHWIVDETREAERAQTWKDPGAFIRAARRSYPRDRWAYQDVRVEVWSEKGTVRGTLAPVLEDYGVTFRVAHGYASATMVKDAADESTADERDFIVLYVGDHDPSGLHMSEEDLPARLNDYGGTVELTRIALNTDDITHVGLPSFDVETKTGDTRFHWYVGATVGAAGSWTHSTRMCCGLVWRVPSSPTSTGTPGSGAPWARKPSNSPSAKCSTNGRLFAGRPRNRKRLVTSVDHPYALDRCDECGALLEPGDRLSGLCETCRAPSEPTGGTPGTAGHPRAV
jgi:hypothetical protein